MIAVETEAAPEDPGLTRLGRPPESDVGDGGEIWDGLDSWFLSLSPFLFNFPHLSKPVLPRPRHCPKEPDG